jgi:exopolysaccharide biosynthesis polyprenyl glycosylphosphotransferase
MMLRRRRKRDSFLPWLWMGLDTVAIYFLLYVAFWVRFKSGYFYSNLASADYPFYYRAFHLIVLIFIFFLRFYGLYRPDTRLTFAQETWKVFKAVFAGTLVLMAITFFIRGFSYSRTFLIPLGLIVAPGISIARFLLGLLLMTIDNRRDGYRNVLVLGADESVSKLAHFYKRNPRFTTRIVGILDDAHSKEKSFGGLPVLGTLDELPAHLEKQHQVHEVVLAKTGLSNEKVLQILYQCEKEMVTFRWIADIFGLITAKMKVSYLGGISILSFMDSPLSDWENRVLKRVFDILFSMAALIAFLPAFALIAFFIKRDSPGPVFFGQERVGQDGRHFVLYKFRTMRADAEAVTGPVWAKKNDERRTRIGTFLRENNLDELPQLWNVFTGNMSLVGPRPERPFFASQFKEDIPRYMARHSIRSGISGWAQVNGLRGNTSIEERTKYDLYYIENWSLLLDIKILFLTLFARRNAY